MGIATDTLTRLGAQVISRQGDRLRLRCGCGRETEVNLDAMRRWRLKPAYRCKSCDVKAYARDAGKIAKFRAAFGRIPKATRTANASRSAKALWHDLRHAATRAAIRRAVSRYDQAHPQVLDAARAALRKKYATRDQQRALAARARASQHGKRSVIELVVGTLLTDLGAKFTAQKRLGYYTYDFLVEAPKPFVIEVQGEYWHRHSQTQDSAKATYAHQLGYSVRHVWEHEFGELGRVKKLLLEWLGMTPPTPIDFAFSDVYVEPVDCKAARVFHGRYHYLPAVSKSGASYGAFLHGELIAVATFSLPVRLESARRLRLKLRELYELSRFCIHPARHKKNFATWFMTRAIRAFMAAHGTARAVISFADETAGHDGTIYKAANFICDGEVKPDYYYISPDGYIAHKKTVWDRARQLGMGEADYARSHGYAKIQGKRKKRFLFWLKVSPHAHNRAEHHPLHPGR
jgi:very-short-patch-repair endonuclease